MPRSSWPTWSYEKQQTVIPPELSEYSGYRKERRKRVQNSWENPGNRKAYTTWALGSGNGDRNI